MWEVATFDQNNETKFVSRENITGIKRERATVTWEITDYEPLPGETSLLMREKRPEEMTQKELG